MKTKISHLKFLCMSKPLTIYESNYKLNITSFILIFNSLVSSMNTRQKIWEKNSLNIKLFTWYYRMYITFHIHSTTLIRSYHHKIYSMHCIFFYIAINLFRTKCIIFSCSRATDEVFITTYR